MPRTVLTPQQLDTKSGEAVVYVTADIANDHVVDNDGRTIILVQTAAGEAVTVAIPSAACSHGRLGDITGIVLGASVTQAFGPFPEPTLWGDGISKLYVDLSAATGTPKIAAVKL